MKNKPLVLVAALAGLLLLLGFTQAPQKAWEYKQSCDFREANKLGVGGWEMVAATREGPTTCFYFKRSN